jgi:hypothetical protein
MRRTAVIRQLLPEDKLQNGYKQLHRPQIPQTA